MNSLQTPVFSAQDVLIIVLIVIAIDFVFSMLYSKLNKHAAIKRGKAAAAVLKNNNFTRHLYIPGHKGMDEELRNAACYFGDRGYIIMSGDSEIVGCAVAAERSVEALRSPLDESLPLLKLVVDNSKNPSSD